MAFNYSDEFKEILRIVGRGKKLQRDLTTDEATAAMRLILSGQASEAQIGAFLVTLRVKDETGDELRGFLSAARPMMRPFPAPSVEGLVDLGLPYDGKANTLQVGVGAALVMAAAGVPMLLHGADDIPTKRGVAALNLLRALGCAVDLPPAQVSEQIEKCCFGVLNIAQVLPQWAALTPIRNQFGLRTAMNTVEKLFNPADAPIHISGVYHRTYLERLAAILPGQSAWLVQGEEGSIDMKYGRKTLLFRALNGHLEEVAVDAPEYGFAPAELAPVPADPQAHGKIIMQALKDRKGPGLNHIILTTGALLWMAGRTSDVASGIDLARDTVMSGKANSLLQKLSRAR
jgi:anthranilate phosphoribosyltransferase